MADGHAVTIAANTGFLWKSLPFTERIARAGRAGFDAVEFHDEAQNPDLGHDLADIRAALREAGLPLLGLNARMGDTAGCAGVPGMEGQAREDIDAAIETAAMLDGRAVHVLAGKVAESEEAWEAYRANLAYASGRAAASRTGAAPGGLTVLIEPLCAAAMPGYLLSSVARAASVIEWVGASNVKIMFDVFHVHGNGDPVLETCRAYAPHIGHVQLAHPETRREPPLDGIGAMIAGLREAGHDGAFGAEYVPAGNVEDGLAWLAAARGA